MQLFNIFIITLSIIKSLRMKIPKQKLRPHAQYYSALQLRKNKNYRPISVLPCFSKILERLMYNRLYKRLSNSKILYPKQFGFQKGHSTDHAFLQRIDQIYESFERNEYAIVVFIDLSKAFDTDDHTILKKIEIFGISGTHLQSFRNY